MTFLAFVVFGQFSDLTLYLARSFVFYTRQFYLLALGWKVLEEFSCHLIEAAISSSVYTTKWSSTSCEFSRSLFIPQVLWLMTQYQQEFLMDCITPSPTRWWSGPFSPEESQRLMLCLMLKCPILSEIDINWYGYWSIYWRQSYILARVIKSEYLIHDLFQLFLPWLTIGMSWWILLLVFSDPRDRGKTMLVLSRSKKY